MIEGSLRSVPFTDVMQIVSSGQKSGVLTVEHGTSRARIYLDAGRVQLAHVDPGTHLGEILVRMDLLTTLEVQEILERQERENAGTPLGLTAVEAGLLDDDDLTAALRRQAIEVLAELLAWTSGSFAFSELAADASQVPASTTYDAMLLLMEADELRRELDEGTAEPAAVYRRAGDPTTLDLPDGSWELLGLVDGRRPARTVAAEADLGEGRSLRLLRRLEELGAIEPVQRDGPEPAVMVVCASPALQRLIRLVLQRVGLRPEIFDGAAAALAAIDELRPSVLLVDDREGEGWDLLRTVRGMPGRGHLPAVVLTDPSQGPGLLARWRRPKAEVLERPFAELDLQQRVARLAGRPLT